MTRGLKIVEKLSRTFKGFYEILRNFEEFQSVSF